MHECNTERTVKYIPLFGIVLLHYNTNTTAYVLRHTRYAVVLLRAYDGNECNQVTR